MHGKNSRFMGKITKLVPKQTKKNISIRIMNIVLQQIQITAKQSMRSLRAEDTATICKHDLQKNSKVKGANKQCKLTVLYEPK